MAPGLVMIMLPFFGAGLLPYIIIFISGGGSPLSPGTRLDRRPALPEALF